MKMKKEFLRFLVVGCVNTAIGVALSTFFTLWLSEIPSFLVGYWLSVIISYFLNSTFVFKEDYALNKLLRFHVSYLPNFLIQLLTVYVLVDQLNVYPLVIYALSACISVPITFIMLKFITFKRKEG